ncbi:Retrovirus-related Pol polyprotein from transposon 17.6, partial [Mucuna pruriens]
MDGFSRYNQIKMALEDMEKTTIITLWGTFCYKVTPFGLKNAGATYQYAMVALFHDMMHKEIEIYVDDMIAKSRIEKEHINNLQKLFGRGIEIDPDKVQAIQEMLAPSTKKEVKGFLGRLNYIARFISQLTATCSPIFKLLLLERTLNPRTQVLRIPLMMYLVVLEESMGYVLGQHDDSRRKEYSPLERMCCALAWATRRLRQYMLAHTT